MGDDNDIGVGELMLAIIVVVALIGAIIYFFG